MKILFIAPTYLELDKIILKELKEQGYEVNCLEEDIITENSSDISIFYKGSNKDEVLDVQWKRLINDKKYSLNTSYDILFMIQGTIFRPILIDNLKRFNRNIKSILYVWDSCKYLNFFKYKDYFDKAYTFDEEDSIKYKCNFLPLFYPKEIDNFSNIHVIYDIMSIGSNHHKRYIIYKKVAEQCRSTNHTFYIKTVSLFHNKKWSLKDITRLFYYCLLGKWDELENLKISKGLFGENEIVTDKVYSTHEFIDIMMKSKAVLDTDNPFQSGATPRLIWALAAGKHIFTTNANIKKLSIYNDKQIHIIDRQNPKIDFSLLGGGK